MTKIKIAIIGCGKQAAKHIVSLKKVPGVEIVVADMQASLAQQLAEQEQVSWVANQEQILTDASIQALVVCTPTLSHVPLIKEAIGAGKDVFCEKPLSDSLEEASKLLDLVRGSDRIVMVGYVYRYVPIFEEGYTLFREKQVNGESLVMGRPLSAYFRLGGRGSHQPWKHQKATSGGAINEMLVHMIDLANWYFGPIRDMEVISNNIHCLERLINKEIVKADAEDFVLTRCWGSNGVEIFCQADLITPAFSQYVEIQSENGSFMASIQADMPNYIFLKESRGGYEAGKTKLRFGQRNLFDIQMMAFIQSVLQRRPPDRNSLEDSLQLMQLIQEIRR
jgi:myo-inositol 2-dehydrogenase/D-chiro-inositol 1-dehydrogenase